MDKTTDEYIKKLEDKIHELEKRLKPYEEMEKHLFHRIQEINDRDEKEKEEEKKEEIKVGPRSHYNETPLFQKDHNGTCCICGRAQMYSDPKTIVDRCTYCDQPYRKF